MAKDNKENIRKTPKARREIKSKPFRGKLEVEVILSRLWDGAKFAVTIDWQDLSASRVPQIQGDAVYL